MVFLVSSQPTAIVKGKDGNLWFTEATGYVGRMTTTGVVAEYPMPQGSTPYNIAAGPDGAVYLTLINGNEIARDDTAGTGTLFDVPTAGAVPRGIALGRMGTSGGWTRGFEEPPGI